MVRKGIGSAPSKIGVRHARQRRRGGVLPALQARRILAMLIAVACALVFLPALADSPVSESACYDKCHKDYEEDGAKCAKVKDESEYSKCHTEAHERYKSCRAGCKKKEITDCKELCKQLCEEIHRLCSEKCKKP